MTSNSLALPLLALLMTSCAVGETYKKPDFRFSNLFGNKGQAEKALPTEESQREQNVAIWWRDFNDEALSSLIAQALEQNNTAQIAASRIRESRAIRRTYLGSLLPQVDGVGSAGRGKTIAGGTQTNYEAGFDASWELDLFGGGRRILESGNADLAAAIADYDNTRLSLAAEVARQYIDYRHFQKQVELAVSSEKAQNEVLSLTRSLFDAGLTSALEVSQAESVVKSTAANVPLYERQREAVRQSLAVLLGVSADQLPNAVLDKPTPIPMAKRFPFIDAPASVIARRPDIIAAERRLASATALKSAEIAGLFPRLTLGSFFGLQDIGTGGSTGIWSLAANAAMPLLNFGTISGRIDAQRERQQQAYLSYRQTVVEALADIETSLSDFARGTQLREALSKAVGSNRETLRLARARYENGLTPFTDVLQAQQDLFVAEQRLAESEAGQAQALVAVYKSLGVAPQKGPNDER